MIILDRANIQAASDYYKPVSNSNSSAKLKAMNEMHHFILETAHTNRLKCLKLSIFSITKPVTGPLTCVRNTQRCAMPCVKALRGSSMRKMTTSEPERLYPAQPIDQRQDKPRESCVESAFINAPICRLLFRPSDEKSFVKMKK